MKPGQYLRLRRLSAGLTPLAAAGQMVRLPVALRHATVREINLMAQRINAAEQDHLPFTPPQARLVAEVVPIEPEIYQRLILLRAGPRGHALPEPRLCRGCGCSDHMACVDDAGPCSWADEEWPLCSHCAARVADRIRERVAQFTWAAFAADVAGAAA